MAKERIKKDLGLITDFPLTDVHRPKPKHHGGEYVKGNVVLIDPVEHMKEHGNYRERDAQLEKIKSLMDDRRQVMKLVMKIQNQLLAYARGVDIANASTNEFLQNQLDMVKAELKSREKNIEKEIKAYAKESDLVRATIGVKGTGPITVANLIAYIDIEKARHASSLWSYAGLHKASHERYTKGESGGGNKTLRTALYVWAGVQIKQGGAYREIYDREKARLEVSEKITKSRNTQGKLIECAWKDTKKSHRHGAAIRKMIKSFLADYWFVARECYKLPTDALYAESMLGMNHKTVSPRERGWNW
jgi:hypothetical protein